VTGSAPEVPRRGDPAAGEVAAERLERWQRRLLPLMIGMVVGLTFFFFVASFAQLVYLNGEISDAPRIEEGRFLGAPGERPVVDDATRFRTLALLEKNTIERRYHQANVLLMSRVWVRYLGFVTGMILSLVGATFILGKLQEQMTSVEVKTSPAALTLQSASPGLVLALMGVVLMTVTIMVHQDILTTDSSVYMQLGLSAGKPPAPSVIPTPSPTNP